MEDILDKGKKIFNLVSVLPAGKLDQIHLERLKSWIAQGRAGSLDYMKRPLDRTDPSVIFPEVKTVVVVAKFYSKIQTIPGVARFAQEGDYHQVIKNGLYRLLHDLQTDFPQLKGRAVVDSAPAFEKAWAVMAGFGWVGRNSLVISPKYGSFFNIGLLLLDREFPSSALETHASGCDNCRLCIDSCPMHAIGEDRMIDARKCISALTVEKKRRKEDFVPICGWSYGCDQCQLCCPYNAPQ